MKYIELYNNKKDFFKENFPEFITKIKDTAFNTYKKLGIPDKSNEDYKYINLKKVFEDDYKAIFNNNNNDKININEVFSCDVISLDADVFYLSKGKYQNTEKIKKFDNGIIVGSLNESIKQYPEIFKKHFSKYANYKNDGITAINTALFNDGLFIYVPENTKTQKPVQLINLLLNNETEFTNIRNLFIIEKNAQAEIIFCNDSLTANKFLTNSVTEIYVGENANLNYYKIQNDHNESANVSTTFIHQTTNSNVLTVITSLIGKIIRNNIFVDIAGKGANNETYGLALTDNQQHIDNFSFVEHKTPNCDSKQMFKHILDDNSTGAFSGKVLVDKNAQKTNALQSNNNILLTDKAKMNTKPQLIIYADDVKCSHGATVGQLDNDAMFYMQARGIPKKEAKMLLMYAFAYEVLQNIKNNALKQSLEDLVQRRLNGELGLCRNCVARIIE